MEVDPCCLKSDVFQRISKTCSRILPNLATSFNFHKLYLQLPSCLMPRKCRPHNYIMCLALYLSRPFDLRKKMLSDLAEILNLLLFTIFLLSQTVSIFFDLNVIFIFELFVTVHGRKYVLN
jgi:hypothetical protein